MVRKLLAGLAVMLSAGAANGAPLRPFGRQSVTAQRHPRANKKITA